MARSYHILMLHFQLSYHSSETCCCLLLVFTVVQFESHSDLTRVYRSFWTSQSFLLVLTGCQSLATISFSLCNETSEVCNVILKDSLFCCSTGNHTVWTVRFESKVWRGNFSQVSFDLLFGFFISLSIYVCFSSLLSLLHSLPLSLSISPPSPFLYIHIHPAWK